MAMLQLVNPANTPVSSDRGVSEHRVSAPSDTPQRRQPVIPTSSFLMNPTFADRRKPARRQHDSKQILSGW